MPEKSLNQRLLIIAIVLILGVFFIYPPKQKLRPGIDIAGGVSMIFEIQEDADAGIDDRGVAEEMKRLLQKRVDPDGIYNLQWRVQGTNRIEVQMPLPPADSAAVRDAYIAAQDKVLAANVRRGELEAALTLGSAERGEALSRMGSSHTRLMERLNRTASLYDAWKAAETARAGGANSAPATSAPDKATLDIAVRNAHEDYADAIEEVLEHNLSAARLTTVLEADETSPRRAQGLKDLIAEYPEREAAIKSADEAFRTWRTRRGFLDGPEDLKRLLRGSGVLEFRILAEPASPDNLTRYDRYREQLQKMGPGNRNEPEAWYKIDNPVGFLDLNSAAALETIDPRTFSSRSYVIDKYNNDWYVLARQGEENGLLATRGGAARWKLKHVGMGRDQTGRRSVTFELDPVGGSMFHELTNRHIGHPLCILVDDVAYSAPNIQSAISSRGEITGEFSAEKINYLVQTMQAGSLPGRLKETPLSERVIGSSLGETNLRLALRAGLIAACLVILIMLVYYAVSGAIANVAMMMNLLLTLAAMAMIGARFTLDGIAGVILSIGMAVDANVLIFERMREEKAKGSSLRMIIKNGYDKAFTTILDSNITTLLICFILYYVGSEEVRGFGLTLGWGIALNLFTSVFVTRTLFVLLMKYNLLKDIKMMSLIPIPNVDWYGMRTRFIPLSIVVIAAGLALMFSRGTREILDIEFLGGVEAEVELKKAGLDDKSISESLRKVAADVRGLAPKIAAAEVAVDSAAPTHFTIRTPEVDSARVAAILAEPLESSGVLARNGLEIVDKSTLTLATREQSDVAAVRAAVGRVADELPRAAQDLADSNIASVTDIGDQSKKGLIWSITSKVTNKQLVQHAILSAIGDQVRVQPKLAYQIRGQGDLPYPITDRFLQSIVPGIPQGVSIDATNHLQGAAIDVDQVAPPQGIDELKARLRNMRLKPDYADIPFREPDVYGINQVGTNDEGKPLFDRFLLAVSDDQHSYAVDPGLWATEFARKELDLVRATLDTDQALRRVTQFKPQIAAQASQQALIALIMSWAMIIAYVWIRFGKPVYGIAGVAALVHDVLIALAFVGFSGLIGGVAHPIGSALLIEDFKVNMPIIAALLTIIGFSINDTIVIFDRVREIRGRLGSVTPEIINRSVNECMSRTILTSFTVFVTLLTMYIFGGSGIRGFNYCMLIGVLSGTYSTIAIAAPLLLLRGERKAAAQARARA